jgi:DNA modification methylase
MSTQAGAKTQRAKRGAGKTKTLHVLRLADARDMSLIADQSVHLVVTSPPYWTLKRYNETQDQLGHVADYEDFLNELDRVWAECFRVLVSGGRVVCVVGDVCIARRNAGRHHVMPLHSDIAVRCRKLGFDNLTPVLWHKISNVNLEVNNGSRFLGKPYEPNAIIKNDIEYILMQRKPGAYRKPTEDQRKRSKLSKKEFDSWFRPFWNLHGTLTRAHPAPFPIELAWRLVRMFLFVDDTVLDPFVGTGTTMIAALRAERNSVGYEIDSEYFELARKRLINESQLLLVDAVFEFSKGLR